MREGDTLENHANLFESQKQQIKRVKQTCVYWISAGEKGTSRWRTTNQLYIAIIQNDSFRRQLVHVWGVDFWIFEP